MVNFKQWVDDIGQNPIVAGVMAYYNACLATDSYKHSHWGMYPPGTEEVQLYYECRGFKFEDRNVPEGKTVFFGLQYIMHSFLRGVVFTREQVEEAREILEEHFGSNDVFNYEGFMYLIDEYGGKLPLEIRALKEGTTAAIHNVLMTVTSRDPKLFWLPGFFEGLLMQMWATIDVATYSRQCKKLINYWVAKTGGSQAAAEFMLHDFGFRGVSSYESAMRLGAAHLINFRGTDTLPGLYMAKKWYRKAHGYSVPAAEHSPVTAWGRQNEFKAFKHILDRFPTGILSVISDSWDIYNAVENGWGGELKADVLKRAGKIVIRPDSGDPVEVNRRLLNILWEKFGGTTVVGPDGKLYKVLDEHVGIIQGDGIDYGMIGAICKMAYEEGFCVTNFVFGSGGGLLQKHNRDELGAAMKNNSTVVYGVRREVYKDPVTSPNKTSKRGLQHVVVDENGELQTIPASIYSFLEHGEDQLELAFLDSEVMRHDYFDEVVARAEISEKEMAEFTVAYEALLEAA